MEDKNKQTDDICLKSITINGNSFYCNLRKNHSGWHFTSEQKFWIEWRE
jgi:hypothetical protein